MITRLKEDILKRFLRYVQVDTMSDDRVVDTKRPSTDGQWDLLKMLASELVELGVDDVHIDEKGIVIAKIPSNMKKAVPVVGFMAHVDTADDVPGNGVKPRVIEKYDGGDIPLNEEHSIVAAENPELSDYVGETLVVTDGTTLLGSDDKAGIAEIMSAVRHLMEHPEIEHGGINIIFTSDEETGAGMDGFPYEKLDCEYCYTVDGGRRFEIQSECFNAVTVKVGFEGVSYHLGAARGRMVNALTMASAFIGALPQAESPEATDGRYGYYCAHTIEGSIRHVDLTVYLRDFDLENLDRRIEVLKGLARTIEGLYPGGKVDLQAKHIYYNMAQIAKDKPIALDTLFAAGKALGFELKNEVIRGGTDGSRMANEAGIPCPNIFTGGYNVHSRYEWAALPAMVDATRLILKIIELGAAL
ncbi:MAG: Peptidase T [Spirochaetes bacterium ADurb.Bin315]|nr:peptidase T [Spirochaetales bacterium]OQA44687.1 MAG: Peptidase T [Spirochaetes bacterium ADurb.Bin315]